MFIWTAGFLISAFYNLFCYINARLYIKKNSRVITSKRIADIFDETAFQIGIRNKPSIKVCTGISGPVITGIIRTELLLPDKEYNDEELRMIYSHELRVVILCLTLFHFSISENTVSIISSRRSFGMDSITVYLRALRSNAFMCSHNTTPVVTVLSSKGI
jgi:hypothetical protein